VDHHVLCFKRTSGDAVLLACINFSPYDLHQVEIEMGEEAGVYIDLFSEEQKTFSSKYIYLDFKGWSSQIWTK
jgi:hypothetical protein